MGEKMQNAYQARVTRVFDNLVDYGYAYGHSLKFSYPRLIRATDKKKLLWVLTTRYCFLFVPHTKV